MERPLGRQSSAARERGLIVAGPQRRVEAGVKDYKGVGQEGFSTRLRGRFPAKRAVQFAGPARPSSFHEPIHTTPLTALQGRAMLEWDRVGRRRRTRWVGRLPGEHR